MATILKNGGVSSSIFTIPQLPEFSDFQNFVDIIAGEILDKGAKIVSFYTRCDAYHIMIKLAEQLKNRSEVTVVFGGPQADIVAQETLKAFPCVDYICQGEGETTIVPFFTSLLRGVPDLSVVGLVYRNGGCVIQNPRPMLLQDLDTLPEIDYSIIGMSGSHADTQRFPIDVGRGCPFGCSYCSTNTFWGRKFRLKSPERICKEVENLYKLYGISDFSFAHDMFTFDRKRVYEVCRLLKNLDFSVNWSCSARVDCIDNELIDCMVDAGMNSIYIGVETGSKRMQKLIHKNLNLDLLLPRLRYLQSKGIHTTVSFIFGFPEETREDLSQTLSLIGEIAKLDAVVIQTHLCTFLPGTELSVRYGSQMVPAQYLSNITGSAGVFECENMIYSHP